ncbi:unnamed protein product [Parascedosporium putredinis]|uniref:Peroxin/Ferlin domain-containing protein n=1 Tax=Parascedosporium putredinis TaxID=1442378 RepID=A0A9P1MB82_9PEZI|nr:unnamed protein product [Parascedosporium putredinis]CAI7995455.1 unnamed protein product [Parascedosporium putredinis]
MPRVRTSRRVSGLKETDYDHEIALVDDDGAPDILVNDSSKSNVSVGASRGEPSTQPQDTNVSPGSSAESGNASPTGDGTQPTSGSAEQAGREGRGHGRGPSIEILDATPSVVKTTTTKSRKKLSKAPTREGDDVVDILYENERGGILCGVTLFSSKALGNLDPPPWTNSFHKTSPTDPQTTQLPDPTWEWAWPEWRIHHHHDVDEGGWEYSFMFSKRFSWHGPHWWNSFVRRRAWIRKRVKKDPECLLATATDPHLLSTDYFTVVSPSSSRQSHSRSRSRGSSTGVASARLSFSSQRSDAESVFDPVHDRIADMDTLLHVLRKARIDREKLEAVGNYLEHGSGDLHNLGPHMHEIMVIFVFQASRKLLLSNISSALDHTTQELEKEATPELQERKASLEIAVKHADEEVRKLAYWSDIKGMVEKGKPPTVSDHPRDGERNGKALIRAALLAPPGPGTGHLSRTKPGLRRNTTRKGCISGLPGAAQAPSSRRAANTWDKVPNLKPIANKSLRVPKNPELVKPLLSYPTSRARMRNEAAVHRSVTSQIMQEEHLKAQGLAMPSWTDTLRLLEKRTPKRNRPWTKHALKIVVPTEYIKTLTTNLDNNIWDIHGRTGCEIELYKGMEGDGRSAVLLSGDDVAVNDATHIILDVCEDAQVFAPDPSNPDASLLRGDPVLAKEICIASKITHQPRSLMKDRKSPYFWNHRLEDLPKPRTWDQFSFFQYIRTLTLVKLRPHRAIEFYGTPQATDEVVMVLIHEAFRDRSAADAVTAARAPPFTQLQIRKLPVDVDVFNKFLYGSAKVRDLNNFNQMLNFMDGYGCVPNYSTWRFFLQMVSDEQAKRDIVRSMDSLGLLQNPHAVNDMVRDLVGFDMHRAVEGGKTVKEFCKQMDEAYGPTWPSVTALNRMLNVCGHFGRSDMCFELLDHFETEYRKLPTTTTFITMLTTMRVTNDFPGALSLLERIEKLPWCNKSHHFTRDLSTIAWNSKTERLLGYFGMPAYVPLEIRNSFNEELATHPEQKEHKGAVISKLIRTVWHGYNPIIPLSEMIKKAWAYDKQLMALCDEYSGQPGSHVLSISDSVRDKTLEIPVKGGREGKTRKVTIRLTTAAIFHNHPDEWFRNPRNYPYVRFSPSRVLIMSHQSQPTLQAHNQETPSSGRIRQRPTPQTRRQPRRRKSLMMKTSRSG